MNEELEIFNKYKWKALLFTTLFTIIGFVVNSFICQPAEIIKQTVNANNIIYNYEWFHQTYSDIKATRIKIANANLSIKESTEKDKWITIRNGLSNYMQDLISQYNAKSKMINRKLFKSDSLPYRFEFEGLRVKEIQP